MASLLNDVPSHPAGEGEGNVVAYLGGECELRVRSYGVVHRINESMVLGMHLVFAHPRRSLVAPLRECLAGVGGPPLWSGTEAEPIQLL